MLFLAVNEAISISNLVTFMSDAETDISINYERIQQKENFLRFQIFSTEYVYKHLHTYLKFVEIEDSVLNTSSWKYFP